MYTDLATLIYGGLALEVKAESLNQDDSVPPGKRLEIPGTKTTTQDTEHREQ